METDEEKPDERDLLCGWRSFRPKFLQRLNTPKWFLVFLTIYSFMQGRYDMSPVITPVAFTKGKLLLQAPSFPLISPLGFTPSHLQLFTTLDITVNILTTAV